MRPLVFILGVSVSADNGSSRLPWFRVYTQLSHLPKFERLSLVQRGLLITCWLQAAEHVPRGVLPNLHVMAASCGRGYGLHPKRLACALDRLCKSRWLDYDQSISSYRIHDWDHYQFLGSDHSAERTRKYRSKSDRSGDQSGSQHGGHCVAPHTNKLNDLALIVTPLDSDIDISHPSDETFTCFLCSKNHADGDCLTSTEHSIRDKVEGKKRRKGVVVDPRYIPLKASLESYWKQYRGVDLGSISTKGDWMQVAMLLRRTKLDPKFGIGALQGSALRFCSNSAAWERKQGLAYWATHAYLYMGEYVKDKAIKGQRTQSATSDLATLRACAAVAPDLLTSADKARIAGEVL